MSPGVYPDLSRDPRPAEVLRPDETVVWASRAVPNLVSPAFFPFPFIGAIVGGFGAFWIYMTANAAPQLTTNLLGTIMAILLIAMGIPLAVGGLLMSITPWWMARQANRALYAITDRRCLAWQPMFRRIHFESFEPDILANIGNKKWRDGNGDLILRREVKVTKSRQGSSGRTIEYGFIGIPNVDRVEKIVRKTFDLPKPDRS